MLLAAVAVNVAPSAGPAESTVLESVAVCVLVPPAFVISIAIVSTVPFAEATPEALQMYGPVPLTTPAALVDQLLRVYLHPVGATVEVKFSVIVIGLSA